MWMPDLIALKRDGGKLSSEELQFIISGIISGEVSKEQIGAWLMAVYHKGMDVEERTEFTRLVRDSGQVLEWKNESHLYVDKHSTGGVGDKMSLALAPALAACGLKVPMIAGRSLAHTGGTIDKLEAIPGFNTDGGEEEIHRVVDSVGCCIFAQSERITPADGILYAIRDVTATVPSVSLITGSIISKKSAEGIANLILDIKVGKAAFMKEIEQARELARSMIDVGNGLGMNVRVMLTSMDVPIGSHIGNSHEVIEILDILEGRGSLDTISLITSQGAHLLQMSGLVKNLEEGHEMIAKSLNTGTAKSAFKSMCASQGVSQEVLDDIRIHLDIAPNSFTLNSSIEGWVSYLDALELAKVASELGAGRSSAEEEVDHGVGITIHAEVGTLVKIGQPIMTLDYREGVLSDELKRRLEASILISKSEVEPINRLLEVIE